MSFRRAKERRGARSLGTGSSKSPCTNEARRIIPRLPTRRKRGISRRVKSTLFTVLFLVRGVQNLIRNAQPLDRAVSDDVRLDDFVHVFRFHAPVPDAFRIHNNVGPKFALIEAAGFVSAHKFYAALRELRFEKALQLALPARIATRTRMARFSLIHANKKVFRKFRHGALAKGKITASDSVQIHSRP